MAEVKRELVLVHGRSQQAKDSIALKKQWLDALHEGMDKSGLELRIPEEMVRFPFYGDTLIGLVEGVPDAEVAEVIVRGNKDDPEQRDFMNDVLNEVLAARGISDEQVVQEGRQALVARGQSPDVLERGPLNWGWVQGILTAVDKHVPGASGASLALFTRDVYKYLSNDRIQQKLESGVSKAMTGGAESVVVSHSLGTVVAYNLLRRQGQTEGWRVPLFVTLGSPLAVRKIRQMLGVLEYPGCVGQWFNAMDPDDVVALYPLDERNFSIDPPIENKTDIRNHTENQHGIAGYLNDKDVARRIYNALVA